MNKLISKLLGKRAYPELSPIEQSVEEFAKKSRIAESKNIEPSMDLFADFNSPNNDISDDKKPEKPVKEFLDRDFENQGRRAGYEYHVHDMLPIFLSDIRSSFRASLERMIQIVELDLLGIQTQKNELGDAIPSMCENLKLRIKLLESNIEEMRMQKILSVDDEGWISPTIQAFTIGYRLGMHDYFQEKSFSDFSIL